VFRVDHGAAALTPEGESMEITEVRVFPVNNEERLKAYVTITIDNVFLIRDLRVINGNAGLFVAMPSRKMKDGTFKDIAHPLNSETRQLIEKHVLVGYEHELAHPAKREQMSNDSEER
jgi:stage V sporulation protein G